MKESFTLTDVLIYFILYSHLTHLFTKHKIATIANFMQRRRALRTGLVSY